MFSESWAQMLTMTNFSMILQLAIIEGLLSFDNALALAALVSSRHKHPLDQKFALLWGIWGAYIMRVGIVFIGVWLMEHEWIKFLAGSYLLWLAINELVIKKFKHREKHATALVHADAQAESTNIVLVRSSRLALWKTILAVELMDLMFSIDSVAVALAVSSKKWVLVSGAVIGILMMRIASSYFIRLIEKFPILIETAFVLVGIAGLKVVLEVKGLEFGASTLPMLGLHVPETVFLPLMFTILIGAILYNYYFPEKIQKNKI